VPSSSTSGWSDGSALPSVRWTPVIVPAAGARRAKVWLRVMVNCASTVWRSSVRRATAVWSWGCADAALAPPRVSR